MYVRIGNIKAIFASFKVNIFSKFYILYHQKRQLLLKEEAKKYLLLLKLVIRQQLLKVSLKDNTAKVIDINDAKKCLTSVVKFMGSERKVEISFADVKK